MPNIIVSNITFAYSARSTVRLGACPGPVGASLQPSYLGDGKEGAGGARNVGVFGPPKSISATPPRRRSSLLRGPYSAAEMFFGMFLESFLRREKSHFSRRR